MAQVSQSSSAAVRRPLWAAAVAAAILALGHSAGVSAQEGFPLKGTWLGSWKGNQVSGDNVFLTMKWDGKKISGMINPGTDNIPIAKASLDPDGWKVHIEADAKDKAGMPIHYVIDGHIEHLELPNRSIVGTWKSQEGGGQFEVSRQ